MKQEHPTFKSFFDLGVYLYNEDGKPLPSFAIKMLKATQKGKAEYLTKHLINKQMRQNRCVGYQYN